MRQFIAIMIALAFVNSACSRLLRTETVHMPSRKYYSYTDYLYDTSGRVAKERTVSNRGELKKTVSYAYAHDGRIVTATTSLASGAIVHTKRIARDVNGDTVSAAVYAGDAMEDSVAYEYGASHLLRKTAHFDSRRTLTKEVMYSYDRNRRMQKQTISYPDLDSKNVKRYAYENNGNRIIVLDGETPDADTATIKTFDGAGRLTTIAHYSGAGRAVTRFSYDSVPRKPAMPMPAVPRVSARPGAFEPAAYLFLDANGLYFSDSMQRSPEQFIEADTVADRLKQRFGDDSVAVGLFADSATDCRRLVSIVKRLSESSARRLHLGVRNDADGDYAFMDGLTVHCSVSGASAVTLVITETSCAIAVNGSMMPSMGSPDNVFTSGKLIPVLSRLQKGDAAAVVSCAAYTPYRCAAAAIACCAEAGFDTICLAARQ
jgi:hypothetical protein